MLLLSLFVLSFGACSLTAPSADEVLREDDADAACRDAIAAFRAAPDDVGQALETARLLFAASDRSVQQAFVDRVESLEDPSVDDVLAVEDELPDSVAERVLGLATTGAEAAQAVVDAADATDEPSAEPNVLLAQHLSFVAWANGPMRSLMAGYGGRIEAAMERALEADPEWDHGAPLRLRGRFLAEAPWPLRNRDESLELLQRATDSYPMPIHHLFLGDLLHDRGDADGALAQWRQVLTSEPDETTAPIAPLHRRLAELRIDAATANRP